MGALMVAVTVESDSVRSSDMRIPFSAKDGHYYRWMSYPARMGSVIWMGIWKVPLAIRDLRERGDPPQQTAGLAEVQAA
jgi:hypothetical protein